MKFGSVCSGIEAASVAWQPLGWKAAWLAEIEPFPCAVLKHHYPDAPNLGDMTTLPKRILSGEIEAPDVFCGGTPCQAFSVAGLRQSLDDERGNLSLTFCEIANAIDDVRSAGGLAPAIIFWENVPGVLSTKDNAFGCFLASLAGEDVALEPPGGRWANAGCVYGPQRAIAWRTLDAQYFGVAQRRRRVFVVASARDGFDPAAVLFEFQGVRRDTAPSREAGKEVAGTLKGGSGSRGYPDPSDGNGGMLTLAQCLTSGTGQRYDPETETILPVAYPINTLTLGGRPDPVNDARMTLGVGDDGDPQFTLQAAHSHAVATAMQVRRLTPVECCRLQGFPDDYLTQVPWRGKPTPPDGPMYKALGNSWAVPVVRWIGERIKEVV